MAQKNNNDWSPLFGKSAFKVAEFIFNEPNRIFHIRKLEKETGLSTTAVKTSIQKLESYKIVDVESTSLTTNVKAKTDSDSYTFYKRMFNLYKLQRYGFVEHVRKMFKPEAIVLFGSFSRGEDVEESDVDILVMTSNRKSEKLDKLVDIMENELKRKLDITMLPSLDRSESEFKNAVANGIILYGYLKVTV